MLSEWHIWNRCIVLLTGFEAAVADFEQWVTLLLLDALQRAGHFKTVGESVTAAALKQKVHKSYARFIDEALSALCRAGEFPGCPSHAALHQLRIYTHTKRG